MWWNHLTINCRSCKNNHWSRILALKHRKNIWRISSIKLNVLAGCKLFKNDAFLINKKTWTPHSCSSDEWKASRNFQLWMLMSGQWACCGFSLRRLYSQGPHWLLYRWFYGKICVFSQIQHWPTWIRFFKPLEDRRIFFSFSIISRDLVTSLNFSYII